MAVIGLAVVNAGAQVPGEHDVQQAWQPGGIEDARQRARGLPNSPQPD